MTLVGSILATVVPTFQPSYAEHFNVSIDLSDIDMKYEPGDGFTFGGTIEDVNPDEDRVNLDVKGPGTNDDDFVTLDEDQDDFSFDYEIDNNAEDGIYSIEVEYDGDSVFAYFLIDEDNDPITIELDNDVYEPGDTAEIIGEVKNTELGEDTVEITVRDPTGDDKVDDADLDNNDEFSYDYDIANDDDVHGRYAVTVSYNNDDNDEGYAIFEVEEGSGSSGSTITASLSKTSYKQGEEVRITGEVEDIEGNDDVVLVVKDPDDDEIFNDSMEPESDKSFEFEFALDDDAKTGTYEATLSYIQDGNEKVLLFSVSTTTSGGGSGTGGSGSSEGLTAKLNKVSYLAGETMTITGVVPSLVDEPVNIVILAPDGGFTGSSSFPDPESDKSYSATLRLKSNLEAEDDYKAVITYDDKEVTLKFDITGTSSEGPLTVETDKASYSIGSTVKITGKVDTGELGENQKVLIRAFNPAEEPYRYDLVEPSSDGSYTYSMVVGGDLAKSGEWQILASYNNEEVETSFQLGTSSGGGPPDDNTIFDLRVNDKTYHIEYELSDEAGQVEEMVVNYAKKKLVISIDSEEDGELTVVLPRALMDASANGTDRDYIVTTRDNAVGDDIVVDFEESENDDESRTLVIEYDAGTDIIEIAGTTIVPEFGLLFAVILAVAIVGIIAATKFSSVISLVRRW